MVCYIMPGWLALTQMHIRQNNGNEHWAEGVPSHRNQCTEAQTASLYQADPSYSSCH